MEVATKRAKTGADDEATEHASSGNEGAHPAKANITQLKESRPYILFDRVKKRKASTQELRVWASAFGKSERTKHLVAVAGGPHLCVCDCSLDMRPLFKYTLHDNEDLCSLAWGWKPQSGMPDMPIIAAAGESGMIWFFDVKGKPLLSVKAHTSQITALAFHPTHPHILFSAEDGQTVCTWSISWSGSSPSCKSTSVEVDAQVQTLCCSSDGSTVLVAGFDSTVQTLAFDASKVRAHALCPCDGQRTLRAQKTNTTLFDNAGIVDAIVRVPDTGFYVIKATTNDMRVVRLTDDGDVEAVARLKWPPVHFYFFQLDVVRTTTGFQVFAGNHRKLFMYNVPLTGEEIPPVIKSFKRQDVVGYCTFNGLRADRFTFVIRGVAVSADAQHVLVTYDPATFALWTTELQAEEDAQAEEEGGR